MIINQKLICVDTKTIFSNKLSNGEISNSSIVFIKDTGEIWTHGKYFGLSSTSLDGYVTLDTEQNISGLKNFNALSVYNEDAYYTLSVQGSMFAITYGNTPDIFSDNIALGIIGNSDPTNSVVLTSGAFIAESFVKTSSSDSYVLLGGGGHKLLSDLEYNVAKYNTLGLVKPLKSYTVAASYADTAASFTSSPSLSPITTTAGRYYAVEMDSNGVPFVNVPWTNTVTTNTDYRVSSGNTTMKIFLVGTTTQADTTSIGYTGYSNSGVYASGGYLYSGSTKVKVITDNFIDCSDTRNVSYSADSVSKGLQLDFKSNAVTGLDYAYAGVITFRPYGTGNDHSEGPIHQLAFDNNGIHYRKTYNTVKWTDWKDIALGNFLPLSGGTMTGVAKFTSGNRTAISFIKKETTTEQARIGTDPYNALGLYSTGSIYIIPDMTLGSSSSNGLVISSSTFTYNSNTILHSGNYNSYAPTLKGVGASGTWGINITGNAETATNADTVDGEHLSAWIYPTSPRNFTQGTIISTNINYDAFGQAFYMEIAGDTYNNRGSIFTLVQGYIYNNTIISYSVNNLGRTKIDHLYAINVNGLLTFWFPRLGYWHSYRIGIYQSSAGNYWKNQCISITDGEKPSGTKEIDLCTATYTNAYTDSTVASASKWEFPRTITLTGSVTGSTSIDGSKNVTLATTTNSLGSDNSIKIYANLGNEVNFGGTSNSSTIFFGCKSVDSRPIPTEFVFGGDKGISDLKASKFIKTDSSDSYVLLGGGGHKALSEFSTFDPGTQEFYSALTVGNINSYGIICDKTWTNGWFRFCSTFLIQGNFGSGILHIEVHGNGSSIYSGVAQYSGTASKTFSDGPNINNFIKIYYNTSTRNFRIYYNYYNNQPIRIRELFVVGSGLTIDDFSAPSATSTLPTSGYTNIYIDSLAESSMNITAPAFYESSDIKLKENIKSINNIDYSKLENIDFKEFNFKKNPIKKYGVIAQDLEKVGLGNLVKGEEGSKSVDYISLLILEIQRLRNEIEDIKKQIPTNALNVKGG